MAEKNIFDLTGKVTLITGGGSGLGRAYCEGMAEFGADVACSDMIEERAKETVDIDQQIRTSGDCHKRRCIQTR